MANTEKFTTELLDINSKEVREALNNVIKSGDVQCAHPYLSMQVYELKDGSTLIDDAWSKGWMLFPPEHDTIRWIKNQLTHLDGSEPQPFKA